MKPSFAPASTPSSTPARYSKVARRMWNDEGFQGLTSAAPNGQTLWVRLLTGPELTNIPGLFPAREVALADALGWTLEGFREAFREVFAKGWVKVDWRAGLVWVPRAPKYNAPESPNVIKSWRATFIELPECQLKREALGGLRAFAEGLPEGFRKAFAEAFPIGLPKGSPYQEQEQEQEQDLPQTPTGASGGPVGIFDFAGDAWCDGLQAALGGPRPPRPRAPEIGELSKVAKQAPATDSAEEVIAWLRADIERFALSVEMAYGGATVRRYVAWVTGGRPERPSGKIAKPPGFVEHEQTKRRAAEAPDPKLARLAAQRKTATR